ncbi:MAG: polynucleotide kinase-phosphatase [Gammaproteobacteria bacterium]|nr:polynucleotide kinase-phosphatase [Gammaproteobacteria bacterium]
MQITVPELSLVVLVGASGSGKTTFAHKHFKATEVLSSDACRAMVADDDNDQTVTKDAFELLHYIAGKRLALGKLVVVDATNVQSDDRRGLLNLAREYHVIPMVVALDLPERLCHERNTDRPNRDFGKHVVRNQCRQLHQSLRRFKREGFRQIHVLRSPQEIESVSFVRQPMWTDKRSEHGPFDIIGDIHGCFDETRALLTALGYGIASNMDTGTLRYRVTPPAGRKAFFVGDLVDRGPDISNVLRLVMDMVDDDVAICVPGNHEVKLRKKLSGKNVKLAHGLAETMEQLGRESPEFIERVKTFITRLISHYVLDDGKLVVAHAGMKESFQGRGSGAVRAFALYGETTGETDEYGLPVRYNWASEYRGDAAVVYGHTPVLEAEWLNNTICIDTGCVFGGKLTAMRYPENEIVQVPAAATYYEPARPLGGLAGEHVSAQHQQDDVLDIEDVLGKRHIHTGLAKTVIVHEDKALAALEVMSRFAVHPKWINYLPPTMSPSETSQRPGLLEHPDEAFAYFAKQGINEVVCEEKHMGSRAIVQVCRTADAARQRFGIETGEIGVCYTRTGRRFFKDLALESEFLKRLQQSVERCGLWEELATDWMTLDCELMPWSMKAIELITAQHAAVGAAGINATKASIDALEMTLGRGIDVAELLAAQRDRGALLEKYTAAYRNYCWTVKSADDLRLAPFHLLASEGSPHFEKDHRWHMETLATLASSEDAIFVATPYRTVALEDDDQRADATRWWESLTSKGGEGMVIKPLQFLAKGKKGYVQPALKCRGADYLRIIYGPEYSRPENLDRLRSRGLSTKRQLALREFYLGLEGLERFVRREPIRRVHECALGVLALESEPVDPRL